MAVRKLPKGLHIDSKMPSFGIRVGARQRTWIVIKGPNRTKLSLGSYPEVSLQEARQKAAVEFMSPDLRRATITFDEAKQEFLALDRWRPQSKRTLISALRHFEFKGPLTRITPQQFLAAIDKIEGRSARAHALKDGRTFFNWCVPRYLTSSPAAGIWMERQPSRDRVLSDDELKAVWRAAADVGYPFGHLVRVLILTGQRCGEIAHLEAAHVEADRLFFPASNTKNGRAHWVPLSDSVRALVAPRSGLVFPNSIGEPFCAFNFNHKRLLRRSGTAGWTLHDLRRTCATGLARLGTPIHVTEKILNHVSGSLSGVAGIYNRFEYWEERRAALLAWESYVLKLVSHESSHI